MSTDDGLCREFNPKRGLVCKLEKGHSGWHGSHGGYRWVEGEPSIVVGAGGDPERGVLLTGDRNQGDPVIEPTDRFCEHGTPAEMPCIICRQPVLNEDIIVALEDFKALSTAFVNLSRSMIQGFKRMNDAMAQFENNHGENLRTLLHEAKQQAEADIIAFGKTAAGKDLPQA